MNYSASVYQKRFWLKWSGNPASSEYNEMLAFEIKGNLDLNKLNQSLLTLKKNHIFLRSYFFSRDEKLYFSDIRDCPFEIHQIISKKNINNQELNEIIATEARCPFDLERPPLWRATVIKISEENYILLLIFHHIILDGNMFSQILLEISDLYNGKLSIKSSQTDDSLDIHQVIMSENDEIILKNESNSLLVNFYKNNINFDQIRLETSSFSDKYSSLLLNLNKKTQEDIAKLQIKYSASRLTVIATIFSIWLYKSFLQENFCMDYPVSVRNFESKNNLIGSFVNTQMIPISIEKNKSCIELLESVKKAIVLAKSSNLPYDKIFEELMIGSRLNQHCVNVVISETDITMRELVLSDLRVKNIVFPKVELPYDISFEYQVIRDKFTVFIQTKIDAFSLDNVVLQFENHLQKIFEYFLNFPDQSIEKIILLNHCDYLSFLERSRFPLKPKFSEKRIEELFCEMVKKYPNHTAILFNDTKITYQTLFNNSLIISKGVNNHINSDDYYIGVYMSVCPELIETIIAILMSGKSYVPLNPEHPDMIIKNIVIDSKIKAVITNIFDDFFNIMSDSVHTLSVKDLKCHSNIVIEKQEFEKRNDISYVLYTSGTTGLSKGVSIKHESVVNLVLNANAIFRISHGDTIPLFHSYSFDFSVWEIWSALLSGACLILLSEEAKRSPSMFLNEILKNKVTILNQTPTALKLLSDFLFRHIKINEDFLDSVRIIVSGGEALYPCDVNNFLKCAHSFKGDIYNMYGITEDCVHSTIFKVSDSFKKNNTSIIGKPLPGKKVLVVNRYLYPVPMGYIGEMLLSGYGLSEGYLGNEKLTEENFILMEGFPNEYWFKTGDYVRLLPSGDFEYLGRNDSQIKIRGYRVDKKNIEHTFNNTKLVFNSTIMKIENQLVLFFQKNETFDLDNLIAQVKLSLPNYMIPSKCIEMMSTPKSINGKINEKFFLNLYGTNRQIDILENSNTRSSSALLKIEHIWKNLLSNNTIRHDINFFDLGGNSLLLYSLHAQLEDCFEIKIPMVELFKYPTISSLEKYILSNVSNEMVLV